MIVPARDRILAHLSRRTTGGRFIPEIDGLRFVAIAMVVLGHVGTRTTVLYSLAVPQSGDVLAGHPSARLLIYGWFGVRIFFVISGFVLALPFLAQHREGGDPVSLRRYYLRRLTRLEPPYLVALTIFFVLLATVGYATFRTLLPHYLAGLVYAHGFVYGRGNAINGAFWSLEVEVQFYLVMPLLAFVFRIRDARIRRGCLVAAVFAAVALRAAVQENPRLSLSLAVYLSFFLAGFLIADVYVLDWKRRPSDSRRWDALWLVAAVALFLTFEYGGSAVIWLTPWIALLLVAGGLRGTMLRRVLANPWIYTIGGMCYSLYLVYGPIVTPLQSALVFLPLRGTAGIVSTSFMVDYSVQLLRLVPQILLLGALFFVLVERPCMNPNWPRDFAGRFQRSKSADARL